MSTAKARRTKRLIVTDMDKSRRIALVVTLVSAAAFIGALYPMVGRIQEFNLHAGLHNYHSEVLNTRRYQIGAFPEFVLTDQPGEGPRAQFESFLRLEYAGKEALIRVKKPPVFGMESLALYDEWVKVLAVNEVGRDDAGNTQPVAGTEQLLIVSRRTPDGFDPESWGSVRRDDWVFDFLRLLPDGTIETTQRRWPRGRRAEARLAEETDNPLRTIDPLAPRTIEYFAAMHVIPKLNVPKYKFNDTALSPRVLGWTLPVSMLSVLSFVGGLIFAVGPRRKFPRRADQAPRDAAPNASSKS